MNEKPQSRAERRRSERATKKGYFEQPTASAPQKKVSQFPLFISLTILFFVCGVVAVVRGMQLWDNEGWIPPVVGWMITFWVAVIGFLIWHKKRHTFTFTKGWLVRILFSLLIGGGLAMIMSLSIHQWQQSQQLQNTVQKFNQLVQQTAQWTVGQSWDTQTCTENKDQQDQFVSYLFSRPSPPLNNEVILLIDIYGVAYQAGCESQWNNLYQTISNSSKKWQLEHQQQFKSMTLALNQYWPDAHRGCQMERTRMNFASDQDPLNEAFSVVCEQARLSESSSWEAGQYLRQARTVLKDIQSHSAE